MIILVKFNIASFSLRSIHFLLLKSWKRMHADCPQILSVASEVTWLCRFLSWSCVDMTLNPVHVCWVRVRSSLWLWWTWCVWRFSCFYWCKPMWLCGKCPLRCSQTAALSIQCKGRRSAWPCLNPTRCRSRRKYKHNVVWKTYLHVFYSIAINVSKNPPGHKTKVFHWTVAQMWPGLCAGLTCIQPRVF